MSILQNNDQNIRIVKKNKIAFLFTIGTKERNNLIYN